MTPQRDMFFSCSDNLNVAIPLLSFGLHASSANGKVMRCIYIYDVSACARARAPRELYTCIRAAASNEESARVLCVKDLFEGQRGGGGRLLIESPDRYASRGSEVSLLKDRGFAYFDCIFFAGWERTALRALPRVVILMCSFVYCSIAGERRQSLTLSPKCTSIWKIEFL